ncbi:MAG: hypothetical protein ACK4QP_13470 [Pseudorhizobium sp.]
MPRCLTFNPNVPNATDVANLREAVRLAANALETTSGQERQHLAGIVFSFVRRGLLDERGLAEIGVLSAGSRVFRSQYSAGPRGLSWDGSSRIYGVE